MIGCNEHPCPAEGRVRFISAWYCELHVPTPNAGHCTHSLAPSGMCAFCGTVVDADAFAGAQPAAPVSSPGSKAAKVPELQDALW